MIDPGFSYRTSDDYDGHGVFRGWFFALALEAAGAVAVASFVIWRLHS